MAGINRDFNVLTQLKNQAAFTVVGFAGDGSPTLYGIFDGDVPGLVPESLVGDQNSVLFGSGVWKKVADSDVLSNEIPKFFSAGLPYQNTKIFSSTDGELMLGDVSTTKGRLHKRSGESVKRRAISGIIGGGLGNALTVSAGELGFWANNTVIYIEALAIGITELTSPGAEAFAAKIGGVFRVSSAGVMTQVGATQNIIPIQENQATGTLTLSFTIGSDNIIAVDLANGGSPAGQYRVMMAAEWWIATV